MHQKQWVNVDPFGKYPSVEISNVELDAYFSTNMVATAMGRAVPAATVWNPIGSFSEIIQPGALTVGMGKTF